MPDPANENIQKAAFLATIADIKNWEIGPMGLRVTIQVPNWIDVKTIKDLASGQVVFKLLPLQFNLPVGVICEHSPAVLMKFSPTQAVCLECGMLLDTPPDDQKEEGDEPPTEPPPL